MITLNGNSNCDDPHWKGGDIHIIYNGEHESTIPSGFEGNFFSCISFKEANVQENIFQLKSTSNDGVCISNLQVNDKQVQFGQNTDLSYFWIDGDSQRCMNDEAIMSTKEMTIKNGIAYSSACKG